jgi:glycosyltransferase involved in cell wall biosynthesis
MAHPLRIGLNLVFLVERSAGAGRYAVELLPSLLAVEPASRITAFVNREAPAELFERSWSGDVDWVRLPVRIANKAHLVAQMTALPAIAARRKLDVLHSPANGGPLVTPGVARVVTLLDLIWLRQRDAWDSARAVRSMNVFVRASAATAHRMLTISESAREDLVRYGLDPAAIDVTPLGVRPPLGGPTKAPVEVRQELGLGDGPIVLCVAQKRPYTNLGALLRALPHLRDAVLVLPGEQTAHEEELRSEARQLGVEERVRFIGWVADDELENLYGAATCFVLPSLVEGFGLPVLEAMARDVPVTCSNRPSLPEVAGDAALLFDPENQAEVTGAIRRLLEDRELRQTLVERGRERVRLFTWERTAEATLASYRRAIAARRGQPVPV